MDSDRRLFKVELTPEISIHEVPVMQSSMISICQLSIAWLVACGDMLLLVGWWGPTVVSGITFEVFRLDLSTEPALWLKMEKLDNWAIFISTDKRSQALSCKNPEIWGGKSNHIYCYNHESKSCITLEMDKPPQGDGSESNSNIFTYMGCDSRMQPMWLVPSMLSLCGSDGEVHDGWLMYLVFRSLLPNCLASPSSAIMQAQLIGQAGQFQHYEFEYDFLPLGSAFLAVLLIPC
ncbi:hypothetical protein ACQ4PT_071486 [Festuca glaucescens]